MVATSRRSHGGHADTDSVGDRGRSVGEGCSGVRYSGVGEAVVRQRGDGGEGPLQADTWVTEQV